MSSGPDDTTGGAPPKERRSVPRQKLVIEVSQDTHERILAVCARRNVPVNVAVREALERAFPKG